MIPTDPAGGGNLLTEILKPRKNPEEMSIDELEHEIHLRDAIVAATRDNMRELHRILDAKVMKAREAELAKRPADFPRTQTMKPGKTDKG